MKLSNSTCLNAKPKAKQYKMFDGGGLYLLIKPNGSKLWRLKYYFLGREKLLSIGAYPYISLKEAREARESAKELLAKTPPIDPANHKRETLNAAISDAESTFKVIGEEWFEINRNRWSAGYIDKIRMILDNDLYPQLGHMGVKAITPSHVLKALRKIESRDAYEIAKRAKRFASRIFKYAIQTEKCEHNPASNLDDALKTKPTEHFRAMSVDELPAFLSALRENKARLYEQTRRAVWISLYTFQRPGEIRQMEWDEIKGDTWAIPAKKMKMRNDHVVPLSTQCQEILEQQKADLENIKTPFVFPSRRSWKKCISDGTVNKAIQNLGFGHVTVAHGFRALAETAIQEELGYPFEVVDRQLAHLPKNSLGATYDRTQFIKERIVMMQDWADFVDNVK